jgi:hypothetical protein
MATDFKEGYIFDSHGNVVYTFNYDASPSVLASPSSDVDLDDSISVLAAPAPYANGTVTAADLLTFVGSGAHDFAAYRSGQYTTYCIYPVKFQNNRVVAGPSATTITITSQSGVRSITYGTDSINQQFTGSTYLYSDMQGPYVTLWSDVAAKSSLDYILIYALLASCVLSLFGSLFRRRG